MSNYGVSNIALAALALACGANDDEVGAVTAYLGPLELPHSPGEAVANMRAALAHVRGQ